jgi:hypothetical protein
VIILLTVFAIRGSATPRDEDEGEFLRER